MAHYAFLDDNAIVVEVIAGIDETETIDGQSPEVWYGLRRGLKCIRTSYNGNIRKNFAGIGYKYDATIDAFIPPRPFDSWNLDADSCTWVAPVLKPEDGNAYQWNEELVNWDLIGKAI